MEQSTGQSTGQSTTRNGLPHAPKITEEVWIAIPGVVQSLRETIGDRVSDVSVEVDLELNTVAFSITLAEEKSGKED
jgi:hypothetical protein